MSLKEKIENYNCSWLMEYLKDLLAIKDLKTYNRVKCLLYYYPTILDGVNDKTSFSKAINYSTDTYICLGINDIRYSKLDEFYKTRRGYEFEPLENFEARYLTIEEFFQYFGL